MKFKKNFHVIFLACLLTAVAIGVCWYKVKELGLPLFPSEESDVWTVEAKVGFEAKSDKAKVELYIPYKQPPGFVILDEDFISGKYGLGTDSDGVNRKAVWAISNPKGKQPLAGKQALYYRMEISGDSGKVRIRNRPKPVAAPIPPEFSEAEQAAIESLIEDSQQHSADIVTLTRAILSRLNAPVTEGSVEVIQTERTDPVEWTRKMIGVLAVAKINARVVYLLELKDRAKHSQLIPWMEVWDENEWLPFDPMTGKRGFPAETVLWRVGDDPLVTVRGGSAPQIDFSVAHYSRAQVSLSEAWARQIDSKVMEFSLFSLPVQTQNVYRILLMVPIGAFLVVALRNLVGIKTFGTFMPVLIALAFRETELAWGVFMFSLLVGVGLVFRFYLEHLKLLLVPRLASVLTIVILLISFFSVISHKLGVDHGLSIALFPVVILSMTIERMSLVWEENGPTEAIQQGMGSMLVASLSYLLMSNPTLMHMCFVFPELLLIVLSANLLLGRYTGYRLSELWRFRALLKDTKTP